MNQRDHHSGFTNGRLTGLDILRAVATLLVVALHAGVPYLPETMPGLAWTVEGIAIDQANAFVTWSVWGIECFIMPLFFVISGVSTRVLLDCRGSKPLLANRRDRLLKPLAYFGIPILITEFYIWNYGNVLRGNISLKQYLEFDPQDYDSRLWGLGHFWYLEYLLIYTLLLCVSCRVRHTERPATDGLYSWAGRSQYVALLLVTLGLAIPCLSQYPNIVADFDHSFFPVANRFVYFAIYFLAGMSLIDSIQRSPKTAATLGGIAFVLGGLALSFAIPQIRMFLGGPIALPAQFTGAVLAIVALGFSVGLTTLILYWNPPMKPAMKYLCAGVYWVYFIHHLLCGAIHLAIDSLELPTLAKYGIAFTGATAGSLFSYHWFIRNRWAETIFNGRQSNETQTSKGNLPASPTASRAA